MAILRGFPPSHSISSSYFLPPPPPGTVTSVTSSMVGASIAVSRSCYTAPGQKITKILWIEGDDGTLSLERLTMPGEGGLKLTQSDIDLAEIIITDKGRILKGPRWRVEVTDSFELVTQPKEKTKPQYRSIYDE